MQTAQLRSKPVVSGCSAGPCTDQVHSPAYSKPQKSHAHRQYPLHRMEHSPSRWTGMRCHLRTQRGSSGVGHACRVRNKRETSGSDCHVCKITEDELVIGAATKSAGRVDGTLVGHTVAISPRLAAVGGIAWLEAVHHDSTGTGIDCSGERKKMREREDDVTERVERLEMTEGGVRA